MSMWSTPSRSEAVGEEVFHRDRPRIDSDPAPVRSSQCAELYRENGLVPAIAERSADEHLVVAGGIVVSGIEQADAGVERRMNRRDAFALVRRAVEVGHAHTAQPEREDGRPFRSKLA